MSDKEDARFSPPVDKEAHENKLIALAYARAEEKLKDGSAKDAIVLYFLRLGTARAAIELEKLRLENNLLEEKISSAASTLKIEEMHESVLQALRTYTVYDGGPP